MVRMIGGVLLCLPLAAVGARFAVGNDPACTHGSLDEALLAAVGNSVPDEIILTAQEIHAGEFTIRDDTVSIVGGFARCDDPAPSRETTLIGRDSAGSRILTIISDRAAHGVTVRNVRFLRPPGSSGGAIAARTTRPLQLTLENVAVEGHNAEEGAGILIQSALEGPVSLRLKQAKIRFNEAVVGGAIKCGPGEVVLLEGAEITNNDARYGAGIASSYCQVNLRGDSTTRLAANAATIDGGGVYFAGTSYTETFSVRRAAFADSGPRIEGNTAGGYGGAVRAEGTVHVDSEDGVFRFNRAGASGGVIYGDWLAVVFSRRVPLDDCAPGQCGVIENNEAGLSPLVTGAGGVVASNGGGHVLLAHQLVLRNGARTGGVSWCDCDHLVLGSVIAANVRATELFRGGSSSAFTFHSSTAAANQTLAEVLRGPISRISVDQSVLGDPVPLVAGILQNPFDGVIQCSVVHPLAGRALVELSVLRTVDPGLRDPGAGDARLREDSVSIDRCARPNFNPGYDLDGLDRGVVAVHGEAAHDAGAYEWRPMFRDGFDVEEQ